jgi:hypothetical protein
MTASSLTVTMNSNLGKLKSIRRALGQAMLNAVSGPTVAEYRALFNRVDAQVKATTPGKTDWRTGVQLKWNCENLKSLRRALLQAALRADSVGTIAEYRGIHNDVDNLLNKYQPVLAVLLAA